MHVNWISLDCWSENTSYIPLGSRKFWNFSFFSGCFKMNTCVHRWIYLFFLGIVFFLSTLKVIPIIKKYFAQSCQLLVLCTGPALQAVRMMDQLRTKSSASFLSTNMLKYKNLCIKELLSPPSALIPDSEECRNNKGGQREKTPIRCGGAGSAVTWRPATVIETERLSKLCCTQT